MPKVLYVEIEPNLNRRMRGGFGVRNETHRSENQDPKWPRLNLDLSLPSLRVWERIVLNKNLLPKNIKKNSLLEFVLKIIAV